MDTSELLLESRLTEEISTDVCIIGAGIAGMSTAYLLAREGKAVVVLDDGPIGGGMTARTTAHLTNALDGKSDPGARQQRPVGNRCRVIEAPLKCATNEMPPRQSQKNISNSRAKRPRRRSLPSITGNLGRRRGCVK